MKKINLLQPLILTWSLTMSILFIAFDGSGQNIGIGTDTPSDKLHIYGGDLRIEDNYPFIILNKLSTSTNTGINFKENDLSKGFIAYTGLEGMIRMTTDADGLRNDLVITDLGKVCIGTHTPHQFSQLHVSGGDIAISDEGHPFLTLNSISTNNNAGINMQENGVDKGWFYLDGGYDVLRMSTSTGGGRDDFIMDPVGNIGIGIDIPTAKLHVSGGDFRLDNDFAYLHLNSALNGSSGVNFLENGTPAAWLFFKGDNNTLRFSNYIDGSRTDLAIASDGKVGIGTEEPGNLLHIFGGDVEIEDYYPYLIFNDTTLSGGKAGMAFNYNGITKAWINYDITGDYIKLSTDDAGIRNDLMVNSTGNIGIGMNNPTQKLHITGGDIQLDDSDYPFLIVNQTVAGGNGGLCVKESGTSKAWMYYKGAEDVLCLTTSANGSRLDLSVAPSGYVGVGTASPEERLHVEGTIEVDQKIQANDEGGLDFATDEGTVRIKILDDGNVGIGTSAPATNLHVNGASSKIRVSGTTSPLELQFYEASTYKAAVGYSLTSDYIFFYEDGNVIVQNGNLGVGQSTIGAGRKIDVLGGGYCSGSTWVNSSDRSKKENLVPVSGRQILDKLSQLDISSWNYIEEGPGIKHIGPMAQDFYALFGAGYDETSISTLDADGISLAAIKALEEENRELKNMLEKMQNDLQELRSLLVNE